MTMLMNSCSPFPFLRRRSAVEGKPEFRLMPDEILNLGFAFWPSRVLLIAVELELFTKIASARDKRMTSKQIERACDLHERALPDFTDVLVSLNLLEREGNGPTATYSNTPETALFLDKAKLTYVGESLEFCSKHLYSKLIDHPKLLKSKEKTLENCRDIMKGIQQTAKTRLFRAKRSGAMTEAESKLTPNHLFKIGFGFWQSRVLLTAVEIGLFTVVSATEGGSMTANDIRRVYGIRKSTCAEFLDTLVSAGMLKSESVDGSKKNTVYQCTPETSLYLDRGKQTYMGGTLDMLSRRSYRFWADLREALETGVMQNEAKQTGWQIWDDLYYNPPQLTKLMESYIGLGHTNFRLLAQKFDFHKYQTLLDVGGATGQLAAYVALEHRHLTAVSTDREQVQPIAEKWLRRWGVEDRVCFKADGMFSVNPFPSADVITMSAILRQWNPTDQLQLIEKAHQALPSHGALIVLEDMIDDDRRSCTHGLCHSLDLLIELGCEGGYNLTQGDLRRLMKEAGFVRTQHMPLTGMTSAMIAYKQ